LGCLSTITQDIVAVNRFGTLWNAESLLLAPSRLLLPWPDQAKIHEGRLMTCQMCVDHPSSPSLLFAIRSSNPSQKMVGQSPSLSINPPLLGGDKRDLGTPQTPAGTRPCTLFPMILISPPLSKGDSRELLELGDTSKPSAKGLCPSARPWPSGGGHPFFKVPKSSL
jgi:hypothetical protein